MDLEKLLDEEVQSWISEHKHHDIYKLAFQKSPFQDILMRDLTQQIQGRKIASKKFEYLDKNGVLFPPKLNLEQTSSWATANHKANLIVGEKIADITGGFGIDSIAFSKRFKQVIHVEKNQSLQKIAENNFYVLGLNNITSYPMDGLTYLSNLREKLDIIYIDPSRRNEQQNKVFLLEDLQPNILTHMNFFSEKANTVLIKLSPLIDIQYLAQTLAELTEIHIIALKNEVKEVLVKIEFQTEKVVEIKSVNLETSQNAFKFDLKEVFSIQPTFHTLQNYLYEPNVAIQKSGGVDILANRFKLNKLHSNTQLFTSNEIVNGFPGRVFEVLEPVSNPKKVLRNQSVMAIHRNFSTKLKDLQKKYKFKLDGTTPILFSQDIQQHLMYHMRLLSDL